MRLDAALLARGLFPSRARAQDAIKNGCVLIDGAPAVKPSQTVSATSAIEITGAVHPYVSRGGVKLDAALKAFEIDAKGRICLDLGASTGGFCDVLLRAGAAKIYAVDVGTGQLHRDIAASPDVINLEKTHAKDLSPQLIPDPIDVIVCDVSFISLKKALPPALALAAPGAHLAALVKPQFEVGRARLGKGGLVKPGRENAEGVAEEIADFLNALAGWRVCAVMDSPIKGGDGNREFLLHGVYEI